MPQTSAAVVAKRRALRITTRPVKTSEGTERLASAILGAGSLAAAARATAPALQFHSSIGGSTAIGGDSC
jgi:hypothetical protein